MQEQQSDVGNDVPYFKCIVCNKQLCAVQDGDDTDIPVNHGIHFQSSGNYGSRFWDLPNPPKKYIEIVLCDWCLIDKCDQVRLYLDNGSAVPFAEDF